ncbi:MAG: PQQ-dependent sugar dehydrogenase [Allosphingosinicella sp.]
MRRRLILIALSLATTACGGGGGGGGATGPGSSQNLPPVFTSGTSATVPENSAGPVYQAAASDPEGRPLTFTISGGPDAARFTISTGGAVSFIAPPDFERPADADANNSYLVTITVSDGVNSVAQNVTIIVTDVAGDNIQVRALSRVGVNPVQLATLPGDRRLAVVSDTDVWLVDSATGANQILMPTRVPADRTVGCDLQIRSVAFSPNFAADRIFYALGFCERRYLDIRRFRFPNGGGAVVGVGERILKADVDPFAAAEPEARGAEIRFAPDGLLYAAVGDNSDDFGRTPGPGTNGWARDLSRLAGKVLRIDVNGDDFPADPDRNYRIPAGNPFIAGGGAPEIFSFGFHIPQGLEFNGSDVLLADRGYYHPIDAPNPVHEIDLVRLADAGGDYGFWNCQGDRNFSGSGPCTFPTILPVVQAGDPALDVFRRWLIGGIVYEGPILDLRGQYLFALGAPDGVKPPSFWSVPVTQLQQGANLKLTSLRDRTADLKPVGGVLNAVMALGEDLQGNAYILDQDGDIFVIAPAP